jgi:hypothetical protein
MPVIGSDNEILKEYFGANDQGAVYLGNQLIQRGATTYISASGGTITEDGDYKVHTFSDTGSSTFTVFDTGIKDITNYIDILLVGGGGGGVSSNVVGGGGGGGQVVYSQSLSVTTTGGYTVTVGSGGAINTTSISNTTAVTSLRGSKGTPSSFVGGGISKESFGGGPGCITGQFPSSSAQALSEKIANGGGQGFGFMGSFSGNYPYVSGSIGTDFNGGDFQGSVSVPSSLTSGAGSGASSNSSGINGTRASLQPGGAGVSGITVDITGTPTVYGGSGAGARSAAGGNGGGGASGERGGSPGVDGLGGGGGGSLEENFGTQDAGKGGNGVVIIRYKYK